MLPRENQLLATTLAEAPPVTEQVSPVFITCGSPFTDRGLGRLEFKIDELFSLSKIIASETWTVEAEGLIGESSECTDDKPAKKRTRVNRRRTPGRTTAPGRKKRQAAYEIGNQEITQCRDLWLRQTSRHYAERNNYPTLGTAFGVAIALLMVFAAGLFCNPTFRSLVYALMPS